MNNVVDARYIFMGPDKIEAEIYDLIFEMDTLTCHHKPEHMPQEEYEKSIDELDVLIRKLQYLLELKRRQDK